MADAGGNDGAAGMFEARHLNGWPYRLLRPRPYDPTRRYPLVLFLHGAGERGADNLQSLKWFVRLFAEPDVMARHPCFVIAPQCPADQKWADVDWSLPQHALPAHMAEPLVQALAMVEALRADYAIDPLRQYAAGLSMGGYGVWDLLARRPRQFAAAVPICGGADEATAPVLAPIPLWVFHGAKDDAVPVARSRNMVAALRQAGGNPKYTEYPELGHNSWTPAAEDPGLLPWLFAQRAGGEG